ncbi:hypothetical protein BZL41_06165 [Pseudomonas sp. PIC25]|uniref:ATP-binding protein n=1 Tax=Pseudomonas sp. PIC25 TaxID=1958773 RepID=UPI000BAB3E1F|nr:ATP-binding protein [Pseudomonas sp. PIC25]PAU65550.1 hypothetical protein BZL41_06165 [Pseudomonas sp. PIC25]
MFKPPERASHVELRKIVRIALERIRLGRPARSVIMVGLRGVGKTVLLNQMQRDAEAAGIQTVYVEAPESRSLPAILAPKLCVALIRMSRIDAAKEAAIKGLRALAGVRIRMGRRVVEAIIFSQRSARFQVCSGLQ